MLALISTPAGSSPVELAEVREPSAAPKRILDSTRSGHPSGRGGSGEPPPSAVPPAGVPPVAKGRFQGEKGGVPAETRGAQDSER